MEKTTMDGVKEYAEGYWVELVLTGPSECSPNQQERLVIEARNEGGCNITQVDLLQLLTWVKANRPDIWNSI